jgi:hypothetical protein
MVLGLALWFGLIFCGALMILGVVAGVIALYEKRTVFVMGALHRDESGAVQGRLRSAMKILFRLVIIAYVGTQLWIFSDLIWFYLHRLVPEVIDVLTPGGRKVEPIELFALFGGGVVGPGLALAAILLAAANKYLALAALSAVASYFFLITSCC